jgi:PAS domain S-box-containing protein
MAKRGRSSGDGATIERARPPALATLPAAQLPPGMPPEMFTARGMLALADLLPIMTAYLDEGEVVRFLNKPLADYLEQPREAILGRPVREMMGEETYAARKPLIAAALAGERQFFVAEFDHPSRGKSAVQSEYVPWIAGADGGSHGGEAGAVRGMIMLIKDVTEQMVAERALKESEARFRRIANSAPAMMWVTRLDGKRDFVNDSYVEFSGLDREAARTADWTALLHPDDRERVIEQGKALFGTGEPIAFEARLRRHDGAWRWLRSVSSPRFGPDGSLVGYIGVATDVTLAKEAELELRRQVEEQTRELGAAHEQLRQSQKMEALGQLTGGIAHDFNNLLTVVVGGLDIIAKRAPDPKLKSYAENALAAAERGARLTGQLLAFSRVQRLEVRPTQVGSLIQNMRPLLRNVLGPGITKRYDIDDEVMPVMADPTQLEVAILNLAINARDAMPDGGVLRFAARQVAVSGDPDLDDGDYVELTISDTGIGMPQEVADRAFEPFFTTKEVGKGTGLGLSMVYGMARQSGGAARIESAPGEGTSVKLLFRKAERAAIEAGEAPDEPAAAAAAPVPLSVLVIDDDPDVRGFIAATLEESGYRVRQVSDGRKGLAEIGRDTPDLVVLDFIMPGLSGADVAKEIRSRHGNLPILFVSGYNETDSVKRTAPDAPLLAKPFRADALHRAVRGALTPRG